MQENNRRPVYEAEDEINLSQFFISTVDFFVHNKKKFLFFNLTGILLGFVFYFAVDKQYASRFTGECMLLPDGRAIELLKELDGLRINEDWTLLGRRLGISPNKAKKICLIWPLPNAVIEKESRGTDDVASLINPMPFTFSVWVRVTDNSILPELQRGLISYLSNNPFNKKQVSRWIEYRQKLLSSIVLEISRLDSLFINNKILRFKSFAKSESNNFAKTESNSELAFKDVLFELHQKKETIEDELRSVAPVKIVQEFTPFRKPIFPDKPILGLVVLLGSNFLCILYILGIKLSKFYAVSKIHHSEE